MSCDFIFQNFNESDEEYCKRLMLEIQKIRKMNKLLIYGSFFAVIIGLIIGVIIINL